MIKTLLGSIALLSTSLMASDITWNHSLSFGLNASRGNTDSTQISSNYDGKRVLKDTSEFAIKASNNFGEQDDEKNTDNYYFGLNYKRTIRDHFYWLVDSNYKVDSIADLDYRFNLSPGLGYRIHESEQHQVDFEGGLGYQSEQYDGSSKEDNLAYRAAQAWRYKISDTSKLWQSAEFVGSAEEGKDYVFTAELGVETKLAGRLSLRSVLNDTFTNEPGAGRKKNDLSFITLLVYSF
jgi:putative salt-induced outer membrane protein